MFSDEFIKEQGIKTDDSPAESEPEEGQENKTDVTPETSEGKSTAEDKQEPQEQETEQSTAETETESVEESQTTEETEKESGETKEEEEPAFDVQAINKFFEKDFKDEDEVRALFDRGEKTADYDEKVNKLSEYESILQEKDKQIEQLKESLNPLSYFTDENAYKAEMIKKQMPDKDPVLIEKVIKSDLSKTKDFDILVDEYLMDNPSFTGDRTRAANVLMDEYGIDAEEDAEEWSQVTKDKIMVSANKARNRFTGLADEVEMPEVVSPEERQAQAEQQAAELKQSWEKPLDRLSNYEQEVITDDEGNKLFDFTVPDDFKSQVRDYTEALVTEGQIPLNEDTQKFVEATIRKEMIYQNLPKILKVYRSDLESQWQQQKDKEEANTTPPNKQTAPDKGAEEGKTPGLSDMIRKLNSSEGDLFL